MKMTKAQNRRYILIGTGCVLFVLAVFAFAALGWVAAIPDWPRYALVVGTFLVACVGIFFCGVLGIGPHVKAYYNYQTGSAEHQALWFIPDLVKDADPSDKGDV